jgi:hypothetical protein
MNVIKEDMGSPTQTDNSIVEGKWDIDGQLPYIQKHFCGGVAPLASGNCP